MTLVEVLVAASLSILIFGAITTVLIGYQTDAQRSTLQYVAQDEARTAIDRIVRQLRNVASARTNPTLIERAGPHDLIFQTVDAPNGSNTVGLARVRYGLPADPAPGSESTQVLTAQTETWNTASTPANPWTGQTACPYTPGSLPAGASLSTRVLAQHITNRIAGASRTAFTYSPGATDLAAITAIGIDLFVDASTTQPPAETELRSGAFLRNQNQQPVASFTATATGGGHVLLNAGGSSDPDNQTFTISWYNVTGGANTLIGTTGLLDWKPGAGTYSVKLQITDPGGLIGTQTQTVVVS